MSFAQTDHSSDSHAAARPDLPQGWRYSDEVDDRERSLAARRRGVGLLIALVVGVLIVVAALLVINAQHHYSQGVAALETEHYSEAVSEFSAARLVFLSYRDSGFLADYARREVLVEAAGRHQKEATLESVSSAVSDAAAALDAGNVAGALKALRSVNANDLLDVVAREQTVAGVAGSLAADLTTEGGRALARLDWGRAVRSAQALLLLDPASVAAGEISDEAAAGQKLSAKLARARAAARDHQWRKALDLALSVLAAHDGFPGAQAVVADARKALKPKPKPSDTQTVATPTTTSSGTSGSTSDGSSGTSSAPAPP